jgi:hypothetical protein
VAKELNPSCSGEISAKERNQDTPDSDHKRRVFDLKCSDTSFYQVNKC